MFLQHPGSAYAVDWSFADHPHPNILELTSEEKAVIDKATDYATTKWDIPTCEKWLRASFIIYSGRYPAFAKTGMADQLYSAWLRAQASNDDFDDPVCLFSRTRDLMKFSERYEVPDTFRFCGEFFPVRTGKERNVIQLIDEMLFNANTGHPIATSVLLNASEADRRISLNPDVEYYFRKRVTKGYETYSELYETEHLLDLISPERRKFVENAAEKGDLEAVLDTTGPCRNLE